MKSPSIEWLHAKLEKQIKLAQSYTEINELEFIIKACRLKPYNYVFEGRNNELILHRWWLDEFGNSLKIVKKQINIIYNDLNLDRSKIICTDLYYNLLINKIVKMSKLVYICYGKDDDLYQDCFLITFLGIDNHLRTYLYLYGKWEQVSPLLIGMNHLKLLNEHIDIKYFEELENKKKSTLPCVLEQTVVSYLPPSNNFVDLIKKQHEPLFKIIK